MRNTKQLALIGLAALLSWSGGKIASAQTVATTAPSIEISPATTPAPENWRYTDRNVQPAAESEPLFPRGHFELTLSGQFMTMRGHAGTSNIGLATAGFNYYIIDGLSIGFEGGIGPGTWRDRHANEDSDDDRIETFRLRASEGMALVRWHFLNVRPVSIYFDGGLGGLHASHAYPAGGRDDNWMAAIGAGLTVRLDQHWHALVGGRFVRLTGDRLGAREGSYRASDGAQVFGGFSYLF